METAAIVADIALLESEVSVTCSDGHDQNLKLGPARVQQVNGRRIEIEWSGTRTIAVLAMGYVYKPVPGDCVLCVSDGSQCYIIGVLQGSGRLSLVAPGDIEIRAPSGSIGLSARNGVHIRTRDLSLTASALAVTARTLVERFSDATRCVVDAFQIRAGRLRAVVEGEYRVKAGRIVERANEDVKIDGSKIRLG